MRDLTQLPKEWRIGIPDVVKFKSGELDERRHGAFVVDRNGYLLHILASSGGGWDHVSVSLSNRTPTWEEMEWVKRTFFKDSETAMQLHVPPGDHINNHPFVLHLWRPHLKPIPMPPKSYV